MEYVFLFLRDKIHLFDCFNMKTKIIHLQVIPKLSGVQRVSLEIMKQLPDSLYDKYILFGITKDCGDKEECLREFREAGCHIIIFPYMKREIGWNDFNAMLELYRLFRREKFDIVHTNSTKPGFIGRIAATVAGVPYVIHTVHGLAFHKFLTLPVWLFYWSCEMFASIFCDKIVLVNHHYMKYFKVFRYKFEIIYNGIDYSLLK